MRSAQNACGPQYRAAAQPPQQRGFFETLFGIPSGGGPGGGTVVTPPGDYPQIGGSGYRTLCVRTCDGYYFPISYSTNASHFADDEATCQKQCPATEAILFSHRNSEDVSQAVAGNGRVYRDLPNAFRYRKEFNPSCSCRAPGQSWADALGQTRDSTIERGDIVVDQERAKALSQPRDAQGRTPASSQRTDARKPTSGNTAASTQGDAPDQTAPAGDTDPNKRAVRPVGPTFIPAH